MRMIDDNTLAAYLEGTLSEKEREQVELAVEEDDELKAVVDEWISMADDLYAGIRHKTEDDRELRMEACRSIKAVMQQVKRESGMCDETACAAMPKRTAHQAAAEKPHWPLYRKILLAASVLAFVAATGIWLLGSPEDGLRSDPSFNVPMGGEIMTCEPGFDTTNVDTIMQYPDYSGLYK